MTTTRSDLFVPEILEEAVQGESAGRRVLNGTGAAVINRTMPSTDRGDTIRVPYFGALGEMDDVGEDVALVPETMTMSTETTTVLHAGKAVEISHWAQLAAEYADPYGEMARQFREIAERRADKELLTKATATLPAGNIHDGTAGTINYNAVVDAKMKWGDEQNDIALMTVHSKVYGDMLKLADTTGRPLLVAKANDGEVDRFAGIPVMVSDRNTVTSGSPDIYHSLLVKRNALSFWYNGGIRVLTDVDILKDNDVAAIHMYFTAHRYLRRPGWTKTGVVRLDTQ
jgi:HK97 family phage major capsid protein